MFGSEILDVAIGLILIYALISVICTAINELISSSLGLRAKTLEEGLKNLLNDTNGTLVEKLYQHPVIKSLTRGVTSKSGKPARPSYIPPQLFSIAIVSLGQGSEGSSKFVSTTDLQAAIKKIPHKNVVNTLDALLSDVGQDVSEAKKRIELWFDSGMERVSGWYKRKIQKVTLFIAILSAALLNVDTLLIADALYQDQSLREATVRAVDSIDAFNNKVEESDPLETIEIAHAELVKIRLPIGWTASWQDINGFGNSRGNLHFLIVLALKAIGLAITGIAVSLGAPFWFDVLEKLMRIRGTGKRPAVTSGNQ